MNRIDFLRSIVALPLMVGVKNKNYNFRSDVNPEDILDSVKRCGIIPMNHNKDLKIGTVNKIISSARDGSISFTCSDNTI